MKGMLTFTQNGVTHQGFGRLMAAHPVNEAYHLVVAWFDGEPELWLVDGDAGMAALRSYYAADWGPTRVTYQLFTPVRLLAEAVDDWKAGCS